MQFRQGDAISARNVIQGQVGQLKQSLQWKNELCEEQVRVQEDHRYKQKLFLHDSAGNLQMCIVIEIRYDAYDSPLRY